MFVKLVLKNFQKHKHLEVPFEEINSIIGATDAGKSAIFRALYWVCFNKPGGSQFIRWGSTRCSVALHLRNGDIVTRSKSKTENTYELNGKVYVSFGAKVPDEIVRALGVCQINFQQQHDSPFWFSLSPGEVSRQLNSIVNLDIIDHSLTSINSKLRDTKAQMQWVDDRITDAKRKIKRFANVPQLQKLYAKLVADEEEITTSVSFQSKLGEQVELVGKLSTERKRLKKINKLPVLNTEELVELGDDIEVLTGLVNNISELEADKPFDLKQARFSIKEMDKVAKEYNACNEQLVDLVKTTRSCVILGERQCRERRARDVKETKLVKMTTGVCPICGSKM